MKKTKFIRALLYGFMAFAFYNCSDVLPQSESIADMGTRALASDATDADFIETDPSLYFSIDRSWVKKNEYKVAIQTKNKYTGDQQDFVITSGTDKIETFKAKPGKPVE